MVAREIRDRLCEMMACCETVRDAYKCDECPIREHCLEDCTFERVVTKVKTEDIDKLIVMADEITDAEYEAQKTEEQKRWEHDADEWLLRKAEYDE